MKVLKTIVLALSLGLGGCAALDFKPLGKQTLKNDQGHIIGYSERGDEADRVILFTPRLSTSGRVMAYEERVKGGVVLWDLRGKRIGSRYVDLRSRGTNANNAGLTIVFVPREAERLAAQQMIAQVTIDDIKQHLGITN